MKIGHKIALSLLAVTMSLVVLFSGVEVPILIGNFRDLQREKAHENLARSEQAIQTELNALGRQTKDWGCWDDTYAYVQNHNEQFKKVNLTEDLFDTTLVDLLFIIDNTGKTIHGSLRLPGGPIASKASGFDPKAIALGSSNKLGPSLADSAEISGVYEVDGQPMLLYARPITDSAQKLRTRGTIIMGRFLTEQRVKDISAAVGVPFTIDALESLAPESQQRLASSPGTTQEFVDTPTIDAPVEGVRVLKADGEQAAYAVLASTVPDILRNGERIVHDVERFFIVSAFAATIFGLFLANLVIANPLKKLADRLNQIGEHASAEVGEGFVTRVDEIGSVARSFEETLTRLSAVQRRLIYASHEAGMTEVARAILHNAGNVLNSVSVSVRELRRQSENSHLDSLHKAVDLLSEHQNDLPGFFATAKGTKLATYLKGVSVALEEERKSNQEEIRVLIGSTKHLADVVQDQRSLADRPENLINIRIKDLLEDSVQVVDRAFARHQISIRMECNPMCRAGGDPSKLQQVLVNLLTNAKEALRGTPIEERRIVVSAQPGDSCGVVIRIEDSGAGIAREQMQHIFEQGFTTKEGGTGFGLHYCANVLKEMGWTIRAESEGSGRGSAFVIESQDAAMECAA